MKNRLPLIAWAALPLTVGLAFAAQPQRVQPVQPGQAQQSQTQPAPGLPAQPGAAQGQPGSQSGTNYGDVFLQNEREQSAYNFEHADVAELFHRFDACEKEALKLVEAGLPLPAYEQVTKASHSFNLLDARRAISVTERAAYIGRVRALAFTGTKPFPELPDVPLMTDLLPGYQPIGSWGMLFAPGKTPDAIADKLNGAVREALQPRPPAHLDARRRLREP